MKIIRLCYIIGFAGLLLFLAQNHRALSVVGVIYLVISCLSLISYAWDKAAAASRGRQRISERYLLTLALLGGWPGAVLAAEVFRHKTRKVSFKRAMRVRIFVNLALLCTITAIYYPETIEHQLTSMFHKLSLAP